MSIICARSVAQSVQSVQLLSCVRLFVTPWIAARQASLSITNSWSSLRLTSIESVMPSNHLILCCPLFLLPPIPPSSESFPMSQLVEWGGQSTGVSALASFLPKKSQDWSPKGDPTRMDWLDLLAVQGTLKSLLPHHSFMKVHFTQKKQFYWSNKNLITKGEFSLYLYV